MNHQSQTIAKAYIEPQRVTIPNSLSNFTNNVSLSDRQMQNLRSEELYLDKLSDNSRRKLRQKIGWMLLIKTSHLDTKKEVENVLRKQVCLITLTLSSGQFTDDLFIKERMLNRFLTWLRSNYSKPSYIWKAEVQSNMRLHFHIIVNTRIDHDAVRREWNKIQCDSGYMRDYFAKYGNESPPSTEVKGIENVNFVAKYLEKYVSKDVQGRKIKGRIWGCSADLTTHTNLKIDVSIDFYKWLERLVLSGQVVKTVHEYCTVYHGDMWRLLKAYQRDIFLQMSAIVDPMQYWVPDIVREGVFDV